MSGIRRAAATPASPVYSGPVPFFPIIWEDQTLWEEFPNRRATAEAWIRGNWKVKQTILRGATGAQIA